ncbi:MAG: hypothetical protein U5M50_05720 [Sphingobium sp.]|nr:hypothetical protein [Sphingobium sp.]
MEKPIIPSTSKDEVDFCNEFIIILGGDDGLSIYVTVLICFVIPYPANVGLLIAGWMLYALFCFSLCLFMAPLPESSGNVIPVVTYIMIPFSGLFYGVCAPRCWGIRGAFLSFVNGK